MNINSIVSTLDEKITDIDSLLALLFRYNENIEYCKAVDDETMLEIALDNAYTVLDDIISAAQVMQMCLEDGE